MSIRIAVLGDAFIDTYHIGTVRGLSAEATIPILDKVGSTELPGGAGNVTANLQALGANAFFLTRPDQNYPVKNRLLTASGEQLARWDEQDWCVPYTRGDLVELLEADAIIVSDYGKGAISGEVIQLLRQVNRPVFVDTKGDPSPWIGSETATLFPNAVEYKRYQEQYNWFPRVVLKRGSEGLMFLEFGSVVLTRAAQAQFVKSVNGAGDTVIAAFTVAALAGLTLPECLSFANAAAANVVEQPYAERWTTTSAVVDRMELDEVSNYGQSQGAVGGSGPRLLGSGSDSGSQASPTPNSRDTGDYAGAESDAPPTVDEADFTLIAWPPPSEFGWN